MIHDIWPDLLRLENLLPFFTLEDLFDPNMFLSEYSNRLNGFEMLSIRFLSQDFLNSETILIGGKLDDLETTYFYKLGEVHHFVHLLRKLYIAPRIKQPSTGKFKTLTAPTIEELHRAGVKFKVGSTKNSLDIQFVDGVLEIPKMIVDGFKELILRNLVAFEQCCCEETYISDYVSIMDEFVDTQKDVELLVKYRIVENILGGGNNELSTIINSLSTGVISDHRNFYYGTLCEELNKFCGSKWYKSMANLRQNYFNTPGATISFVAALLLIIL